MFLASHVNLNSVKSLYGGITRSDKNVVENIMEKKELELFQFYTILDNNYVPDIDINKSADLFVKNEH